MRSKKKVRETALQVEEDYVIIQKLVNPGNTSAPNYFSLAGDHCGYSRSLHQEKSLENLYLKHSVWSNVLSNKVVCLLTLVGNTSISGR